MGGTLNISVCTDETYALLATMTLRSAIESVTNGRTVRIFLVDTGIDPATQKRIRRALQVKNVDLHWLKPNLAPVESLPLSEWTSPAAHARLLLPHIIPNDVGRLLYLDSDMMVLKDLGVIWEYSFDGVLMACQDLKYPHVEDARAATVLIEAGLNPKDDYFNSGLLLINIEKWLASHTSQRIIDVATKYGQAFTHRNQDPMNVALRGQWEKLPSTWNVTSNIFEPISSENHHLRSDPNIVHFTGNKPDSPYSRHPFQSDFLALVKKSNWFSPLEYIKWVSKLKLRKYYLYLKNG